MQDHAINLTHLSFYTQRDSFSLTLTLPGGFAVATSSKLSGRLSTETFHYSRVKFVVHYFLGESLSGSDHSLLNSAGTAARSVDATWTRTPCADWSWRWAWRGLRWQLPGLDKLVCFYTHCWIHVWFKIDIQIQNTIKRERQEQQAMFSHFIHTLSHRLTARLVPLWWSVGF